MVGVLFVSWRKLDFYRCLLYLFAFVIDYLFVLVIEYLLLVVSTIVRPIVFGCLCSSELRIVSSSGYGTVHHIVCRLFSLVWWFFLYALQLSWVTAHLLVSCNNFSNQSFLIFLLPFCFGMLLKACCL